MTTHTEEEVRTKDPVCGMMVLPSKAAGSLDHEGHTYHFCGKGCIAKFTSSHASGGTVTVYVIRENGFARIVRRVWPSKPRAG